MGDDQSEKTKWAQDIYWGHFQHIHFSQFLHPGFDKQIAIPKKFCDNLRKKLPDSVTLKGPGGGTWTVGVTAIDDSLFFKHGWPEFASDHPLAENDFLVFKFNGESAFEVLIFDGKTLCEKEYSYFVKKSGSPKQEPDTSSLIRRKFKETVCDEINNASSSEHVGGCISPEEKSRDEDGVIILSRDQIVTPPPEKKTGTKLTPVRAKRVTRGGGDLQLVYNSPSSEHTPTRRTGYGMFYASNRRYVSDDERATTLLLAQASMSESDGGFLVIMQPSHVYKRFYVLLPSDWVSNFISLENQDLFLRVGEREWRTRFNYNRLRSCSGITSGWKHFSIDNNLEQFDVVVFKPGDPVNNSLCLDVKIFRVVPEITQLTRLATCPKSENKKRRKTKHAQEEEEEDDVE